MPLHHAHNAILSRTCDVKKRRRRRRRRRGSMLVAGAVCCACNAQSWWVSKGACNAALHAMCSNHG